MKSGVGALWEAAVGLRQAAQCTVELATVFSSSSQSHVTRLIIVERKYKEAVGPGLARSYFSKYVGDLG